ncbi:hypothetical protein [Actinoplanes sp. N902-109]|uniref:hypothetical protein n=1 Tax=Actinoplanes sp. (strain N902-109) TaxID=649831 RepID=UPI0003295020|nr:hypothetical protein [Actinoplanes sp. N902-109]AGL17910.1 hypothetical protein L083_4400 [Actinoplanes sp. N902-109]
MSATRSPASTDDIVARAGRWLIAKVWLGCVLSAAWATGQHFGWPHALLTVAAVVGAVAMFLTALWLPAWTLHHRLDIPFVDVSLRVVVWAGLAACVLSLFVSYPAVGAVAGALLLHTAWLTVRHRLEPLLQGLR